MNQDVLNIIVSKFTGLIGKPVSVITHALNDVIKLLDEAYDLTHTIYPAVPYVVRNFAASMLYLLQQQGKHLKTRNIFISMIFLYGKMLERLHEMHDYGIVNDTIIHDPLTEHYWLRDIYCIIDHYYKHSEYIDLYNFRFHTEYSGKELTALDFYHSNSLYNNYTFLVTLPEADKFFEEYKDTTLDSASNNIKMYMEQLVRDGVKEAGEDVHIKFYNKMIARKLINLGSDFDIHNNKALNNNILDVLNIINYSAEEFPIHKNVRSVVLNLEKILKSTEDPDMKNFCIILYNIYGYMIHLLNKSHNECGIVPGNYAYNGRRKKDFYQDSGLVLYYFVEHSRMMARKTGVDRIIEYFESDLFMDDICVMFDQNTKQRSLKAYRKQMEKETEPVIFTCPYLVDILSFMNRFSVVAGDHLFTTANYVVGILCKSISNKDYIVSKNGPNLLTPKSVSDITYISIGLRNYIDQVRSKFFNDKADSIIIYTYPNYIETFFVNLVYHFDKIPSIEELEVLDQYLKKQSNPEKGFNMSLATAIFMLTNQDRIMFNEAGRVELDWIHQESYDVAKYIIDYFGYKDISVEEFVEICARSLV